MSPTVALSMQPGVAAPSASARPAPRVLVVDDDEFVRLVLERQLTWLGARVSTARDGDGARRVLREQGRFDIVLCDLKMPGVDGVELLRDFAETQADAALVLMSSCDARTLAAAEQLARARDLHLLGTVSKPIGTATLKSLLERFEQLGPAARKPSPHRVGEPVAAEALRAAIAAGEIDVYMQPKVDLETGELAGAEALARWIKPDGMVVMPDAFLGVAERAGLMDDLTDLVVRQALAACGQWQAHGLRTSVSINIPASGLERLDLPELLAAQARHHGVEPDRVVLEITETGAPNDLARSLDVVTRLRLRGFRLAVDDFGMGHSSLERLRKMPFTELKLDRAFVDGAARNPELRSIVESSIQLARSLHLNTCAEGVETRADLDVMRALGCDAVQGFLLSHPMPKDRLPAWAESHRPRPVSA
jgi:EAL domain-containing protein (putative c-di-GMP-specific phosphodiesterase class I)